MSAKTWITYRKINGKEYKIFNYEWDYYGGSKILTSRMELINESHIKSNRSFHKKNSGENYEKG